VPEREQELDVDSVGCEGRKATAGNNIKLSTTSPSLPGKMRSWNTADEFMQDVMSGRIYDGVHYRNSTEVGNAMGRKIGELAANKYLK
jgi:hypothetical protein